MTAGKWLARAPILWVMDEAPADLPSGLLLTLIAVARYADEQGRGAYPAAQTIAYCTHKTRRQARRDLDELEARGLLLPGDQRLAKDIRADRRPKVYDLPMNSRGVMGDPPHEGSSVTPRKSHGGTSERSARGHLRHHEGSSMTPEESLRTPRTARASHARAGSARGSARGQSKPGLDSPCPRCRSGRHGSCAEQGCGCFCNTYEMGDTCGPCQMTDCIRCVYHDGCACYICGGVRLRGWPPADRSLICQTCGCKSATGHRPDPTADTCSGKCACHRLQIPADLCSACAELRCADCSDSGCRCACAVSTSYACGGVAHDECDGTPVKPYNGCPGHRCECWCHPGNWSDEHFDTCTVCNPEGAGNCPDCNGQDCLTDDGRCTSCGYEPAYWRKLRQVPA